MRGFNEYVNIAIDDAFYEKSCIILVIFDMPRCCLSHFFISIAGSVVNDRTI